MKPDAKDENFATQRLIFEKKVDEMLKKYYYEITEHTIQSGFGGIADVDRFAVLLLYISLDKGRIINESAIDIRAGGGRE